MNFMEEGEESKGKEKTGNTGQNEDLYNPERTRKKTRRKSSLERDGIQTKPGTTYYRCTSPMQRKCFLIS
jgi:hypothetical protein